MRRTHPGYATATAGRPTIGMTIRLMPEWDVWLGALRAAKEYGVNLVGLAGERLRAPGFVGQSNVLYDLISAERLDGLVVWGSLLATQAGAPELQAFCDRYRPLPLVSVGSPLPGIPSVLVGNRQGMRDAVGHLIEVHGFRSIAFIRGQPGNPEGDERYRAYCDTLTGHGIPVDEKLVVFGDWYYASGAAAVGVLLDERKVRPEAVVSCDDEMAYAVLDALRVRGIPAPGGPTQSGGPAVPGIAVVGFDDMAESRFTTPPLTTVRQSRDKVGWRAIEIVLAMLSGETVPERVIVPTELIVRQSCGCQWPEVVRAAIQPAERTVEGFEAAFGAHRQQILSEVTHGNSVSLERDRVIQLVEVFGAEVSGRSPGAFVPALDAMLQHTLARHGDVMEWQGVLSTLRRYALPCVAGGQALSRAEDLFQQAQVLVGEVGQRSQARKELQTARRAETLLEISQMLVTALSVDELMDLLAQQLPRLGIKRCYVALYEDPEEPAGWSRLVLACDEHGRVTLEEEGRRYPSAQLLPAALWPTEKPDALVVAPLYFRQHQLGFVIFDAKFQVGAFYEALRGQISSALEVVLLSMHNAALYEEALQARAAAEEADRLKSRFLAMVSHELRTPLSLIVGTIEMMLEAERRVPLLEPYHQDVRNIRASAHHLSRLISDVLDLASSQAGELRIVREPLNLREVLEQAVMLGELIVQEKGLGWRTAIPEHLPLVQGDRTRLRQVILNLISNAVKFTERGEVSLSAELACEGVTVSVSDTGIGIPAAEQEAIFDEFRRSERAVARGYGGLGLGLAITRRVVELHGGTIGVRSSGKEGAGSTFYFTLPIPEERATGIQTTSRSPQTVLLLTEHADGGEELRAYLVQRGFEVDVLATEDNANWFAQVIATPPGAVVLDFQPVASRGWELMEALRGNPATQDVPVIFYTLSNDHDSGSILGLDHLAKPVGNAELARALDRQGLRCDEGKAGKTVLVVDDDPGVLDVHARSVQSQVPGCRVLKAQNGPEALAIMARERPDLVLLDLIMPGMSGVEVLEAMREQETTRDVPVIVLTAAGAVRSGYGAAATGRYGRDGKRAVQHGRGVGPGGSSAGTQQTAGRRRPAGCAPGHGLHPRALYGAGLARGTRASRRVERAPPRPLFPSGNGRGHDDLSQPLPDPAGQRIAGDRIPHGRPGSHGDRLLRQQPFHPGIPPGSWRIARRLSARRANRPAINAVVRPSPRLGPDKRSFGPIVQYMRVR